MIENCGTCRFWDPAVKENGSCRRHAPRIIDAAVRSLSRSDDEFGDPGLPYVLLSKATAFPVTFDEDWCGEYEGDELKVLIAQGRQRVADDRAGTC